VEWVMGRYFTPDTVLRDRRQKYVMKIIKRYIAVTQLGPVVIM